MFNPWANLNPNQQLPFWGQPVPPSNFMPPLFDQLFDLGSIMRTIQQAAPAQTASTDHMKQLEEMIRAFSAAPLFAGLPNAMLPQQNTWAGLLNFGNTGATTPFWSPKSVNPPALGIGREFQEDTTRMNELHQQYNRATQEFRELFEDFVQKASETFLASLTDTKEQPDFGALCRKWIDCCEDEFQSKAQTPEYSTRLGNMINAYLRMTRHSNSMQEKLAGLYGYPTRSELDNLHRKNVQAQIKIEALEKKIIQLESNLKPQPKSASRRRRSPKKPTT